MNKIKIDIPKGHKALFDETKGEITFVELPKDIKERVNTFADVLRENNMTEQQYQELIKGRSANTAAYESCKLIVAAYNEGQLPDYSDTNQRKYHPRFQLGSSSGPVFSYHDYDFWRTGSFVGARLDYLSYDNMIDAVTKFLPYYEQLQTS
jgi:hypothetical protein